MTTITTPANPAVQATFLRAHCRLFAIGMKHSRVSATDLRRYVETNTGKRFKRGDWNSMIDALNEVIRGNQ